MQGPFHVSDPLIGEKYVKIQIQEEDTFTKHNSVRSNETERDAENKKLPVLDCAAHIEEDGGLNTRNTRTYFESQSCHRNINSPLSKQECLRNLGASFPNTTSWSASNLTQESAVQIHLKDKEHSLRTAMYRFWTEKTWFEIGC